MYHASAAFDANKINNAYDLFYSASKPDIRKEVIVRNVS
jgi:hypothetical protein